jgi:hypothetical protein
MIVSTLMTGIVLFSVFSFLLSNKQYVNKNESNQLPKPPNNYTGYEPEDEDSHLNFIQNNRAKIVLHKREMRKIDERLKRLMGSKRKTKRKKTKKNLKRSKMSKRSKRSKTKR